MSEDQQATQEQQVEQTAEERARIQGWVPKEEFRGDPDRWVDAETFAARGDNELPILRERLRSLERRYTQQEKTIKEFADFASKAEERSYKRALDQIRTEQRQAVAEGDVERFDAAQKQMEDLQRDAAARQPKPDEPDPEAKREFDAWHSENKWYLTDRRLTAFANGVAEDLAEQHPELVGTPKLYAEVEREVKAAFPDKFDHENKNRRKPGAVQGGGDVDSVRGSGKRSYSDLPKEAKEACDRFVKAIPGYTRDRYVKEYAWD
jgi:hypothetical protein